MAENQHNSLNWSPREKNSEQKEICTGNVPEKTK